MSSCICICIYCVAWRGVVCGCCDSFSQELNHSTLALGRANTIQTGPRSAGSSDDITKVVSPYREHPLPTSQANLIVCFTNHKWFISSHQRLQITNIVVPNFGMIGVIRSQSEDFFCFLEQSCRPSQLCSLVNLGCQNIVSTQSPVSSKHVSFLFQFLVLKPCQIPTTRECPIKKKVAT